MQISDPFLLSQFSYLICAKDQADPRVPVRGQQGMKKDRDKFQDAEGPGGVGLLWTGSVTSTDGWVR